MSIYDEIGGAPAVEAAVDDFYLRVLGDARLVPFFAGIDLQKLKRHQRAFLAAAVGGPELYAGRGMGAAHEGLGIGDAQFDAVIGHLIATLTSLDVRAETIAAIGETLLPLRTEIVAASSEQLAG